MINFVKELFDNDKLVAIFFITCLLSLLIASFTLININYKMQNERLIEITKSVNITEAHEQLSETDCMYAQLRCYRDSLHMNEDDFLAKCREIDFCLSR